ncbi:MAG: divergent polysaccharide deacetylase family protein [Candidatus Omnitrophota bacterium]
MKKTKKINPLYIVVAVAAAIIAAFVYNVAVNYLGDRAVNTAVDSELSAAKVTAKDLVGKVKHFYIEKRYWVRDDFQFGDFRRRLEKSLNKAGFAIGSELKSIKQMSVKGKDQEREEISYLITERNSGVPILRLTLIHKLARAAAQVVVPAPPKAVRPKLAIVLDDWGYNTKNVDGVLKIKAPLTLSVLPALPYSTVVAEKARARGFQVIMHMPMEPKAKMRLELSTLCTSMSEDEIRASFNKSLQSVPYASGISNHEGSKATEDLRLMGVLFDELKKHDMFFLDSLVTNDSSGEYLAKKLGVKFAKRSIFLDNESDPSYIKKQFERAAAIALKNGEAVAIGHDRQNTIAVLTELVPGLDGRGIDVVPVSELAR